MAEEVATERHDARGRRHRGNPGLAWRDARRRRGGGPKFIAHPPQRNKRAPLGAAVLDALKHGKGGKGSQPERKRQARTSSRLVPRLTQFHLASAGVQWWKREDRNFRLQDEVGCPERTAFSKEERKSPGFHWDIGEKTPPRFPRSAEWVEQGHSGKVTPGAPPPSLPHPAGPATSVCSVCRGEGQHRGPSRTPYLGGSYLGPRRRPEGGATSRKDTDVCLSPPAPF